MPLRAGLVTITAGALSIPFSGIAAVSYKPDAPALEVFVLASTDIKAPVEISGRPGAVARTQAGYEVIARGPVNGGDFVALDYEFKYTDNRFRRTPAPYGDTQSHFLGAKYNHLNDERHGFGIVGGVELAAENEAGLTGDGLRGGLGPTWLWNPSAQFSTETGLTIQSQFGQSATISPYLKWVYTPEKSVEMELRATGLQNGLIGTWFITENKATSLRVSLLYETMQYALRPEAAAEGVSTGELPLRITFTQFLSPHLFASLRAEAVLWHRERFHRDDREVDRFETHPGTSCGLLVGARF